MKKIIIIISLISVVLIAVGYKSATNRNLENSKKALDNFRQSRYGWHKFLADYYRSNR